MDEDRFITYLMSFVHPRDSSSIGLYHPESSKRLGECTKKEIDLIDDNAIHGMIKRMVRYLEPVWEDATKIKGLMIATRPFGIRMHTQDYGYANKTPIPENIQRLATNMKRVLTEKLSSIFSDTRNQLACEYTFHEIASSSSLFRIQFRSTHAIKNFTELVKTPI